MQHSIEYLPDLRIVRATTSGTVTRQVAVAVAADLATQLKSSGTNRFLVDHRSAVVDIGIVDLYYLVNDTHRVGLGPEYIGAIVFRSDTHHDFRFYGWRAANAGFRRCMFTDIDAALAWLNGQAPPYRPRFGDPSVG
jgi:hypothetical protein